MQGEAMQGEALRGQATLGQTRLALAGLFATASTCNFKQKPFNIRTLWYDPQQ